MPNLFAAPHITIMSRHLFALAALSLFSLSVRGHGYVQDIVSGSTHYTGYLPYTDPYYNPVPSALPVYPISVQCNGYTDGGAAGSAPAPIYATVAAGSKLALNWTTWPDSHMGPIITYMARAPSDITKWNPGTSVVWFKVAQSGKTSDGKWAATDLLTASKSIYTFTIPPKLKAGQYIIRHEIIALHAAYTYPGAQVYPGCIQVQVTGSGAALPTSFVSFPGAYTASTPGIVYDAYTSEFSLQPPTTFIDYEAQSADTGAYPIPGPSV
ncbi:hypothetical protein D9619_005079 [Psilocybe cf. subviscida]|uniref:lytic cellulose monooxygenase (C4-dehydrogenating) n=1 Tax=Psilocybe cf. subviscida TaxID=2480587 RepID=A0A8H5F970_9AGAR|nr:hypothetical protein D9619_005079 [Psilocybe cf. subviscida]